MMVFRNDEVCPAELRRDGANWVPDGSIFYALCRDLILQPPGPADLDLLSRGLLG